jgi:hypothetical protein
MGFISDFVSDPVGTVQNKTDSALGTTLGIADDVIDYGSVMGKDLWNAQRSWYDRNNPFNQGNWEELLNDPLRYGRESYIQPIYGDGQEQGLWDKYGQWTALASPQLYALGESGNIANDYYHTRDEDLARKQATGLGATLLASELGNTLFPGQNSYLQAAGRGATTSAGSALGRGAEEDEVMRAALVGGAAGAVGYGLGGSPSGVGDPSLNLGQSAGRFGSAAVHTWDNMDRNQRARMEYDSYLNDWRQRLDNNLNSSSLPTETPPEPELRERTVGTPLYSLFDEQQQRGVSDKRLSKRFGMESGMGNDQIALSPSRMYL